jgi:hypothetical protein
LDLVAAESEGHKDEASTWRTWWNSVLEKLYGKFKTFASDFSELKEIVV